MAILELISVAGLGVLMTLLIVNLGNNREQQRQLDSAFYRLVAAQGGKVSLIQLSALAGVSPEVAQKYLDHQVQLFLAFPEIDDEGNTFYQFPKLRLPPRLEREW
ncbi:hypothetical protein [Planktothrix agardhii]|jgi:hypothetical protein|uniref:Uncharacterized protein n=2 Tax=Planktothrix agardhii TaxID=1160 RepID=A0A073CDS4_PLAA1|nr:hypothetical protein [Planktothrix agardhii]MCF3607620.1 hypothetical protein [Planktothrix agardhii 1033]BBD55429.1 hypothetical protein NIES204_27370 [Planktothrix agardhii NIES-204]KEI66449.1 hypothetical protein A19Y_1391 [Planktothrix agardhii NIVA-CYA 126/8]MBG0747124.1 hypothetical protein [Planktothrix agardhii KL2]MCB8751740.1 hypothetical protein [Planktothrix agardhii 1810]